MEEVILLRTETGKYGTFGNVIVDDKHFCYSIEQPWKNNQSRISCIPIGEYTCVWHKSPHYGWLYMLTDVPNRKWILNHPGNFGGDTSLGYKTHTLGCVLFGKKKVWFGKQKGISSSKPTIRKFQKRMDKKPFLLKIIEAY